MKDMDLHAGGIVCFMRRFAGNQPLAPRGAGVEYTRAASSLSNI